MVMGIEELYLIIIVFFVHSEMFCLIKFFSENMTSAKVMLKTVSNNNMSYTNVRREGRERNIKKNIRRLGRCSQNTPGIT